MKKCNTWVVLEIGNKSEGGIKTKKKENLKTLIYQY